MTAVSLRPDTRPDPNSAPLLVFRWKEQGFLFELRSTSEQVIQKARKIFPSATTDLETQAALSWNVEPDDGSTVDDLTFVDIETDVLQHIVDNPAEQLTVHAALLTRHDKGVVIVGPSFAGKSTLATGLWRAGWTLMADDLCLLDPAALRAYPAPRRVSLRTESRAIVGESLWNEIQQTPSFMHTAKGLYFHPHEVSANDRIISTPLTSIFFLARLGASAGPAELVRLHEAKAALALLPYAFNARVLPLLDGLRRVSPICERAPAFDLGRGDIKAMIAAVESTVG